MSIVWLIEIDPDLAKLIRPKFLQFTIKLIEFTFIFNEINDNGNNNNYYLIEWIIE